MDSKERREFDKIIFNSASTSANKMEVLCFNWQHNYSNTNSSLTIKLNEQVDYKFELVDGKVEEYNTNFRIHPEEGQYFCCHDKRHRILFIEIPKEVEAMKILTDLHQKMSNLFEIGGFGYHCEASEKALEDLRKLVPLQEDFGMRTPLRSLVFKKVDSKSIGTILKYTTDYLEIRMDPEENQKNTNFKIPLKARDVKIESAFWMTSDSILTSESCRRVRMNRFNWGGFDFNHFVDEWMKSGNTKLEFLRITYKTDTVAFLRPFDKLKEFKLDTVAELRLEPYNCFHRKQQLNSKVAYEVTRSDGYKATIHQFRDGNTVIHMFVWKPNEVYPYWDDKTFQPRKIFWKCGKKDFEAYINANPLFTMQSKPNFEADSFVWNCGSPNMNPSLTIQLNEGLVYKFEILFKGKELVNPIQTSFPGGSCAQVVKEDLTYRIRAKHEAKDTLKDVSGHLLRMLRPRKCSFSLKFEDYSLLETLLDQNHDLRIVTFCRSISFKEVPYEDNSMEKVRKFPSDYLDIQMKGLHKEPVNPKEDKGSKSNEDATASNRTVYNGKVFKARDLKIQGDFWIDPIVLLTSPVTQRIRMNHVGKDHFHILTFAMQWCKEPFNKTLESIRVIYTGSIEDNLEKTFIFPKKNFYPESVRRRKLDPFKSGHRVDQLGKEAIEVMRDDGYKATIHFKDDKKEEKVRITTVHMFIWRPHEFYPYFSKL